MGGYAGEGGGCTVADKVILTKKIILSPCLAKSYCAPVVFLLRKKLFRIIPTNQLSPTS